MEMSLKDLMEDENLKNPRAFSGICDVNYVKVGCYKEQKNNVALPQELFQDRFANQPNYSGQNVDWADYSNYLKSLACRCAKKSQEKSFKYFGLQDYGRCFSGQHVASTYNTHGSSNNCYNQHYKKCDDNAWGECVGKNNNVNYVYEIQEAGSANGEIGYGQSYDETYGGETKEH